MLSGIFKWKSTNKTKLIMKETLDNFLLSLKRATKLGSLGKSFEMTLICSTTKLKQWDSVVLKRKTFTILRLRGTSPLIYNCISLQKQLGYNKLVEVFQFCNKPFFNDYVLPFAVNFLEIWEREYREFFY